MLLRWLRQAEGARMRPGQGSDGQPCCRADLQSGTDTPERDPFSRFPFCTKPMLAYGTYASLCRKQPEPGVAAAVRSRLCTTSVHLEINRMGTYSILRKNKTFYQRTLQWLRMGKIKSPS